MAEFNIEQANIDKAAVEFRAFSSGSDWESGLLKCRRIDNAGAVLHYSVESVVTGTTFHDVPPDRVRNLPRPAEADKDMLATIANLCQPSNAPVTDCVAPSYPQQCCNDPLHGWPGPHIVGASARPGTTTTPPNPAGTPITLDVSSTPPVFPNPLIAEREYWRKLAEDGARQFVDLQRQLADAMESHRLALGEAHAELARTRQQPPPSDFLIADNEGLRRLADSQARHFAELERELTDLLALWERASRADITIEPEPSGWRICRGDGKHWGGEIGWIDGFEVYRAFADALAALPAALDAAEGAG